MPTRVPYMEAEPPRREGFVPDLWALPRTAVVARPGIVVESPPCPPSTIGKIAMLGNHAPRQCGIATFTTDLSAAIAAEFASIDCFVLAMNDPGQNGLA